MDASSRFGESTRLPAISISSNPQDPFRPSDHTSSFSSGYSPSNAIKIPGLQREEPPPPPLPPPPLPFRDYSAPDYRDHNRGPGSSSMGDRSFFGSFGNSLGDERPAYKRWDGTSASKPETDEGYASLSSTMSRESLPGGFGLHHNRFQFQSSADAYCDKLKNKLNPIRTLDLKSPTGRSGLSASATDVTPPRLPRYPPALTVLPIHTRPVLGSPDRFTQTPLYSAVSPRSAPFDLERSPRHHPRRLNSGSLQDDAAMGGHGGYDAHGAEEMEMEETSSMRRLRLDDSSRSDVHTIGLKRRASSPPGDEPMHGFQTPSDMVRRRDVGSRGSPTPRLATITQGSMSSVSSAGRSGSFASSTFSMAGTSMTSVNSYGRRSPGGLSPGGMSPITSEPGYESPYTTPVSLTQSPGEPMGRPPHQRTISESMPMSMTQPLRAADIKVQRLKGRGGWYMCECCPKKPKKFRTTEDLSAHEAEKQYECSYCGNRFKNKNEAERHQNSLHVRRHSWSCKALVGYARAFHDSTTRAGKYDVCGYCGDEFPRTGLRLPGGAREATEADWDDRIRHLTEVHKFRECNSSKKFFRADHFRQHLKHSHAGTSGKWTNMLENACMMDEDPTPR